MLPEDHIKAITLRQAPFTDLTEAERQERLRQRERDQAQVTQTPSIVHSTHRQTNVLKRGCRVNDAVLPSPPQETCAPMGYYFPLFELPEPSGWKGDPR